MPTKNCFISKGDNEYNVILNQYNQGLSRLISLSMMKLFELYHICIPTSYEMKKIVPPVGDPW